MSPPAKATINNPDASMELIRDAMMGSYPNAYSPLEILLENENELQFQTRHKGNSIKIQMHRPRHKPLTLDLKVSFQNQDITLDTRHTGFFESRVPWYLGSYLVITLILNMVSFFFILFFMLGILFGVIYLVYKLLTRDSVSIEKNRRHDDLYNVLDRVTTIVYNLRSSTELTTKKCWNCFGEVAIYQRHCGHCGQHIES